MSVVLVVEPDSVQAEVLRKAVRRIDAELMLVSTTAAAIEAMRRSVPDLVLVSALLSPRDEDALFAHLRSLEGSSHLQTLTIPQLRRGKDSSKKGAALFRKKNAETDSGGCDPALFAHEVRAYLARAHEMQSQAADLAYARAHQRPDAAVRPHSIEPLVPVDSPFQSEQPFDSGRTISFEQASEIDPPAVPLQPEPAVNLGLAPDATMSMGLAPDATVDEGVAPQWSEASPPVNESHGNHDASAEWSPTSGFDETIEPLPWDRPEDIEPTPAASHESVPQDSWTDLNVDAFTPPPVEPKQTANTLTVEEVQSQLTAELQRFEQKAQQRREEELLRAEEEAQARLTAEVERVQAESEQRRHDELARVQAEAEAQRQVAVTEARAAAEAEARSALVAELEQVRIDEIARVQAEADQRIDAAAKHARQAAEAEASRAMAEELGKIRAQVEYTLNNQLEQARVHADQLRESEVARARAEAAKLRDAAAQDARLAAEAAANRALETEVARVRADAEARLQAELDVMRQETEHLRRADKSEAKQAAEKVQAAAARDARAITEAANHTLAAELARVRAEADARLEAEVARARAQAEHQRTTELEEIRAQVAGMRDTASQQARRAAAEAIALEVVRGFAEPSPAPAAPTILRTIAETPTQSASASKVVVQPGYAALDKPAAPVEPPAATPVIPVINDKSDYYSLWKPRAQAAAPSDAAETDATDPMARVMAFARSKWALPAAAAFLLVVGSGISMGWPWHSSPPVSKPEPVAIPVRKPTPHPAAVDVNTKTGGLDVNTDPPGARVLLDGVPVGESPIVLSKLKPGKHTLVFESKTGILAKKVTVRAGETARVSESIFSGWLAVFAGIPLKVYVGGQLRGTTEDGQLMLTPGTYDVELVSERFNYRETRHLTIEPGKVVSYTVALPASVIRINASEGTDVSIDGRSVGKTPLGDLPVAIGTHEVVGTHADLGRQRQSIEVKLGEPSDVTLK